MFFFLSFFFYKIGEQEGRTGPFGEVGWPGGGICTSESGEVAEKGVGG
jgi:hypothetical protein